MPARNAQGRLARYAVIMAGGSGTRFWPRSRRRTPKQFLAVGGRRTLLQETARRLQGLVPRRQLIAVAGREFAAQIRQQLPALASGNVLIEPAARGTAACIALAAEWVARRDPNALLAVFPADHVITDLPRFRRAVATAFVVAERQRCLVTFGITPTWADPGFGYIEIGERVGRASPRVFWAARFHEKPDPLTARRYVAAGRYLWNSGMFVWRVDVIRAAIERHAPGIARAVRAGGADRLGRAYRGLPMASIDVAVMERAARVAVVEGTFGWSDVGSWAAMAAVWGVDAAGNARRGDTVVVDSHDTVVCGDQRVIALLGVDDLVVVDSPDAVLVCRKSRAQEVRRVVDALARGRHRHLL